MGALQKFEKRLGEIVEGAFARVFKGQVEPVEVAAALQREAAASAAIVGPGRTLVHNRFTVDLGSSDAARLLPYSASLCAEFAAMVREHAEESGWSFPGPVEVHLVESSALDTGVFRVRSEVAVPASSPVGDHPALPDVPRPSAHPGVGPARPGRPRLVIATGGEVMTGSPLADGDTVVDLVGSVTVLGRGTDVDLRLADTGISRRHAEIRTEGEHLVVVDLASTNGTTVNGQPVDRQRLHDGDRIEVGRTVLTFRRDTDEAAPRRDSDARDGFDRVDGA